MQIALPLNSVDYACVGNGYFFRVTTHWLLHTGFKRNKLRGSLHRFLHRVRGISQIFFHSFIYNEKFISSEVMPDHKNKTLIDHFITVFISVIKSWYFPNFRSSCAYLPWLSNDYTLLHEWLPFNLAFSCSFSYLRALYSSLNFFKSSKKSILFVITRECITIAFFSLIFLLLSPEILVFTDWLTQGFFISAFHFISLNV